MARRFLLILFFKWVPLGWALIRAEGCSCNYWLLQLEKGAQHKRRKTPHILLLPTLGVRAFKKIYNPKAQGGFLSLQQYTNEWGCYTTGGVPQGINFCISLTRCTHTTLLNQHPLKSPFTNKLYGHMLWTHDNCSSKILVTARASFQLTDFEASVKHSNSKFRY